MIITLLEFKASQFLTGDGTQTMFLLLSLIIDQFTLILKLTKLYKRELNFAMPRTSCKTETKYAGVAIILWPIK